MVLIVGQLFGLVAVAFAVCSYQMNTNKKILMVQMCSCIFFCIHYWMLGAWSGLMLNAVAVLRNVVYYHRDKKQFAGNFFPILFAAVMALLGVLTWQGWYSLFITVGLTINTVCMSFTDPQNIRKSILVTSPLVLIYNIFVLSIGGSINETLAIVSSVIGIARQCRQNKKEASLSQK